MEYELLKNGQTYKFWNKIVVAPATHSCEYEDSGVITLTAVDIKPWISAVRGEFYNCTKDLGYGCNHMIAPNGLWYTWPTMKLALP